MVRKKPSKIVSKTAGSKKKTPAKKDFLVVGIGASAGGVRTLQDFFAIMPPNCDMAFVVVLHLSPEHESRLPEIIQTQTGMKVIAVDKSHKVEPNHVYVIPPNRQLEMVDGVIRSAALASERGSRVAIDVFFRTLAEAYEKNAVCIVLTGTGTDGTLGLKAIKEANGFAIVQDPSDAEYDSMPRSAIATQLVDWVLPVSEMPEKLIGFRNSSERLHLTEGDDGKVAAEIQADESLREILTVLRVRTGHDFSNYKTPTLVRRIARHLQIHDLDDIPAYLAFLRENPEEIQSLLKNLLINVTNFFRDKEAWAVLEREVVPTLFVGKKAGDTIRAWSCGCASGEEAYGLGIILSEYAARLADPPKIQIFATDVDEDAIAEAREHLYPQSIETDVSPARLRRFFVKEGKYYRIRKELREMVLFAPHNVLRDPPFSKLDLIACRNLLIYLNRETQERVMEIFHFALAAHGYLFLGSSETAEGTPQLFASVDKKHRIYSRRPVALAQQSIPPRMPVVGRWEVKLPEYKPQNRERAFALGEVHYKLLEQLAPPSILVNQEFEIQYLSESAGRYLRFKGGEPSNNLLKLVNPDLLPDLRAALFTVQRENRTADFPNVRVRLDGHEATINLIVRAVEIENESGDYFLVVFDENRNLVLPTEESQKKAAPPFGKDEAMEAVVLRLEDELGRTRDNLRTTIEQHEISIEELKASNEELQAINEELRSTTEELETSKEELQSVNEELTTVNHELKEKIDETTRTNSDLQNLMASTDIATIFLDREFRIKRFTPPVERIFNITGRDVGRPLEHFTHRLDYKNLSADAAEVLRRLTPIEREVRDNQDATFMARFLPYRTIDDRIEGVVLNFIDITERKRAEAVVAEDLKDTRILHRLSTVIVTPAKMQKLNDEILKAAIALTRADAGTVQIFEEKTNELVLLAAKGFERKMTERFYRIDAASQTSCGIALRESKRIFVDFDAIDLDGSHKLHLEAGYISAQSTPLIARSGRPLGMFTTHWRERRRPTERELRFLDILARQAADLIEHWQVESAFRISEEKYRNLFTSIDEGYCIIEVFFDPQGKPFDWRFIEINPAFEKNNGLKNAVGKTIRELAPDIESKWFDIYGRVAATGEPLRFEEHSAALGRWFNLYAFRVGTPGENRVAVVFTDITTRKQAEQSLAESEERMRIAIESAGSGTWEWDLKTDLVIWNDQHFLMLGLEPNENPRSFEDFFRFVHGDDRPRVEKELKKAIRQKADFRCDFRIITAQGETRWMSDYGRVLKLDKGKATKMAGVMFDVTERKRAEVELKRSEERFRAVVESASDFAIFTLDENNTVSSWSPGAENIFGWKEKEILGRSGEILFTPEDRAKGVPAREINAARRTGRAEDERWHIRRDGTLFYASGLLMPLVDGETGGFVKICRDQTEKIRSETARRDKDLLAQLVVTQEDERRRIARDIHDHIGQQLTALRLKLAEVAAGCDDEKINAQIETVREITEKLDREVDFLAWELRPASLDDLGLRVALENFVTEWARHTGIRTEFHATGLKRMRLAFEIETNLYRIAQEALNNIYKHAAPSRVSVILEKRGELVSLIIEDNGKGFNPKEKRNRTKGMGLVGMIERAKICGGELEIESSKGKGTTVFARIPLKQ